MHLHQCVADVACVAGISKFAQTFFKKHVLFFKLNFNSNLPATHATQFETPMFPHFLPIFTCYTCCYTSATKHLVPATHDPRTTIHEPYFTDSFLISESAPIWVITT